MKYRLGLDMGATSIGWSVFDIENESLVNTGVRIFDDGREDKSKASLCVKRRNARSARRLNNRKHIQINFLLTKLKEIGLFPQDDENACKLKILNPYELRTKALYEPLKPYELGRALFHLAQRKGFKSSRKDNKKEGGKLSAGYELLKQEMETYNAQTYGEYLYQKSQKIQTSSLRLKNTFDETGKFKGGLFPFREVYQHEFNIIWDKQKDLWLNQEPMVHILSPQNKKCLYDILFFQRPLKEQEEGECTFEKGEKRIAKAHPLFQEFRIWQTMLNLSFSPSTTPEFLDFVEHDGHPYLDLEKREKLIYILKHSAEYKVTQQGTINFLNLKKALSLDTKGQFNFEAKKTEDADLNKGLLVDTTEYAISNSKYFKPYWDKMDEKTRGELINLWARPHQYVDYPKFRISTEQEDKLIIDALMSRFHLSEEAATELLFDIDLEDDYAMLSEKAISKLLPYMKQGINYTYACEKVGYMASYNGEQLEKLPYYGQILSQSCLGKKNHYKTPEEQFGKISNATVHVALNQVRHLVNEIIDRYGKPFDLAIEYARDLNASAEERKKMTSARDKNEAENNRLLKELSEKLPGCSFTKYDLQKYKIWKNMAKGNTAFDRECPFSGKKISIADLFNGQMFQIEHLIPFSRSLDDSLDNKVISSVEANRYKANRTPFEAFGESKDGYNWKEIQSRAKKLSYEQQWRFAPDAMKQFEEQESPIARSLNDTRYMTRLLQQYLKPIMREDGKKTVQSIVGALTSMIRKSWNLNLYKNTENPDEYRLYHNHHAVDAFIVSAVNRGQIKQVVENLKFVRGEVKEEFKNKFHLLRDSGVSKEERLALKKEIRDFIEARETAIINAYIPLPRNVCVDNIKEQIQSINISHKPNLKELVINPKHNETIGRLHEDTAYGLKEFVKDSGLDAVFVCDNDIMQQSIAVYIPMFYEKEDKNAYYDAFKKWYQIAGKAASLVPQNKEEKEIKKNLENKEKEAENNLRSAALKAFKWFVSGNNYCADVYQINLQNKICGILTKDAGAYKTEIISNYNATVRASRGEDIAYWRYKYPNAKRIMRLKRNDMVMATFSKQDAYDENFFKGIKDYVQAKFENMPSLQEVDILFRVKKMGDNGICLTPHDIAKEKGDEKSWITSAGALQKYKARKVYVSYTGRIGHAK